MPEGGASPVDGRDPELEPMFGQFLLEPEDDDPVELLDGVEVDGVELDGVEVDPVELVDPDELVPELLEFVVAVLVAASAANAPPTTSPLVNAPMASALRTRSFMMMSCFPGRVERSLVRGNTAHRAGSTCGRVQRPVGLP
jgi:hypothetical protein